MLRLPKFDVAAPVGLDEALALLREPGTTIVAGGTDLLPNLKHRLYPTSRLVSLGRVEELKRVFVDDAAQVLRIGTGVTLASLAEHPEVQALFPSLAYAAGQVASPLIRTMATIGGNIHLEPRCRYVNQTEFWRSAIGGCLKSEGDRCHVVPGGRNCVAAMSSDCVPVLVSLDGAIMLREHDGGRELPLVEYFRADGRAHVDRRPGELATELRIPLPTRPRRTVYRKWSVRKSIDFPLVSVALRFDLSADRVDGAIERIQAVVGVLGSRPREVTRLEILQGRALNDPSVASELALRVHQQCKPLENVPYEAPYRRHMLQVLTARAVRDLVQAG